MSLEEILLKWGEEREKRSLPAAVDARYAYSCGLPVLGALCDLAARLEGGERTIVSSELLIQVRDIIRIALLEAQRRSELAGAKLNFFKLFRDPNLRLLEERIILESAGSSGTTAPVQ